ncbi:MAG: hypothetical protein R6V50_05780 [Thermoplasmatota archaeon]
MKKILIVIGICFLLLGMPTMMAVPLHKQHRLQHQIIERSISTSYENNTPPDWAAGNFSGVWGLNVLGVPLPPIGWVKGYFANQPGVGRLEAGFAEFNVTNATGFIGGLMIWVFFIGGVVSAETGNGTYVAGIGVANETHFYWRLNAIIGPTYYILCEYAKFEE